MNTRSADINHFPEDEFPEDLADRLRRGDRELAELICRRYVAALQAKARAYLQSRHGTLEPEDVVQSALKSFFRGIDNPDVGFGNWESLWGYLATIVVRKCYRRNRKRVPDLPQALGPDRVLEDFHVLAREPSQEESLASIELLEYLQQRLDDRQRVVLDGRLAGEPISRIAARVERSERYVNRTLLLIRDLIAKWGETHD